MSSAFQQTEFPGILGGNPKPRAVSTPPVQNQVQVSPCPVCFALVVDMPKHSVYHSVVLTKRILPWEVQ
jgi:hypothetical protein